MPDTPTVGDPRKYDFQAQDSRSNSTTSKSFPAQPTSHVSRPSQQPVVLREKPVVQPKPRNLQLHISQQLISSKDVSKGDDALAERFSQLRTQRKAVSTSHETIIKRRDSADLSSSTEYTPSSSEGSSNNAHHGNGVRNMESPTKPSGPRSMLAMSGTPAVPPKIPLSPLQDNHYHLVPQTLPQPPQPTYDPSKPAVSPNDSKKPTLSRKRSIIGNDNHSPRDSRRYSGQQIFSNGIAPPSRSSSMQPTQTSISAKELYDRFHTSSVLVIDVRSREHYDSGHILAKNSVCIEPVGIQYGMSAEELEDRLTISPGSEQSLFNTRELFDLIVYHDQCTQSDQFLKGPPTLTEANHLRALHDTLFEFSDDKPLRRRPLVLLGGLESWVDLVGPQALAFSQNTTSNNSTGIRRALGRPNKPTARVPTASSNSSLEVRKRRLREQKPLNPDEEQRWLEKARKEEVNPTEYQTNRSDGDPDSNDEEPPSPFVHSYEDFLRRFPELGPVELSA